MSAPGHAHNSAVFTCPYCGHPNAMTVEPSLDIHEGADYGCDECGGRVVFVAFTLDEYKALEMPVVDIAEPQP